jgi:hypothetical protein
MLIRVHIHDGNYYAALRDYDDFHSRMLRELGIAPSDQMRALVNPVLRLRAKASVAWTGSRIRSITYAPDTQHLVQRDPAATLDLTTFVASCLALLTTLTADSRGPPRYAIHLAGDLARA